MIQGKNSNSILKQINFIDSIHSSYNQPNEQSNESPDKSHQHHQPSPIYQNPNEYNIMQETPSICENRSPEPSNLSYTNKKTNNNNNNWTPLTEATS